MDIRSSAPNQHAPTRWCPAIPGEDDPRHAAWSSLVTAEPRLLGVWQQVLRLREQQEQERNPRFCANKHWYGYGVSGLKPQLEGLVGWERPSNDRFLTSMHAYDVALDWLFNALPFCQECLCQ